MNEYKAMFTNYFNFSDRTTVRGYWMAVLINFIVSLIISIIGYMFDFRILTSIYSLAVCIPTIAMSVRRMHDAGRTGLWILIALVPIIGWIWYFILTLSASAPDDGRPVV